MYSYYILSALAALSIAQTTGGLAPGPGPSFATANQSPNATGSIYIEAANVSLDAYSLSNVVWKVSVNVTDFPSDTDPSRAVTNTVLSFDAGPSFVENNTVWDTCLIVLEDIAHNATVKGQDDESRCYETLGEGCMEMLKSRMESARVDVSSRNYSGPCGGMAIPAIPEQCFGSINSMTYYAIDINSTNQTDGQPLLHSTGLRHDLSNYTEYEIAATRVWPIVILQTSILTPRSGGVTHAGLGCLRAKNTTTGSQRIGDVPGLAAKLGGRGIWRLLFVAAIVSILS